MDDSGVGRVNYIAIDGSGDTIKDVYRGAAVYSSSVNQIYYMTTGGVANNVNVMSINANDGTMVGSRKVATGT
jgi:hypothetical protein